MYVLFTFFFFSRRRRHTRFKCDWSSDVCSSDLLPVLDPQELVQFTNSIPLWETGSSWQKSLYAYPQLESFQAHSKTMAAIFGETRLGRINVGYRRTSAVADGDGYSDHFFSALRITP